MVISPVVVSTTNEDDVTYKISENLTITDFVKILFKGWASAQRAIESPIKVEEVNATIITIEIVVYTESPIKVLSWKVLS